MIIRPVENNELDVVVDIWLESSKKAHHFIPDRYWEEQSAHMKQIYIPNSDTWISLNDQHHITGFFSLVEHTLAAIFVAPAAQGKGTGKSLLDKAKSLRPALELCVYKKNTSAIAFYTKNGFSQVHEQIDANTGEKEIKMQWASSIG